TRHLSLAITGREPLSFSDCALRGVLKVAGEQSSYAFAKRHVWLSPRNSLGESDAAESFQQKANHLFQPSDFGLGAGRASHDILCRDRQKVAGPHSEWKSVAVDWTCSCRRGYQSRAPP